MTDAYDKWGLGFCRMRSSAVWPASPPWVDRSCSGACSPTGHRAKRAWLLGDGCGPTWPPDEAERVSGRIGEHSVAVESHGAESKDSGPRGADVLDHDVEVHLLRDGRARPRRRTMIGGELECELGCRVVLCDDDEIVAVVGDRLAQQRGVEPCESSEIGAVKDAMVQPSVQAFMISPTTDRRARPRCCAD